MGRGYSRVVFYTSSLKVYLKQNGGISSVIKKFQEFFEKVKFYVTEGYILSDKKYTLKKRIFTMKSYISKYMTIRLSI